MIIDKFIVHNTLFEMFQDERMNNNSVDEYKDAGQDKHYFNIQA